MASVASGQRGWRAVKTIRWNGVKKRTINAETESRNDGKHGIRKSKGPWGRNG